MAIEDVLRNMDRVTGQMADATEKAVYECGADLLQKSNEITPKDEGNLRKSAKVTMINDPLGVAAVVSYGDSRVDYAEKLHEVRYNNYSEPNTGWKYLEKPLNENRKKYEDKIGESVEVVLK